MSDLREVFPRGLRAFALALMACAAAAPGASARISDPVLVDGPSAELVDLGGVDMAEDGTGGLVYRKRVDGRAHIFAARFDGRGWTASARVDAGQRFDSSWPQIAAGEGGRLLVTWVQELGAGVDRMFSALLGPGATRFGAPVPVDFNVGEAIATYPSLAMNAPGTAYLAYRVVFATSQGSSSLPAGTVDADVRVARTTGSLWSVAGQPLDRNPVQPVATPTALNSPRIGVDRNGAAVVAWQEPGDDQVDRVWARRVFDLRLGNVLQVSPAKLGAAPLQAGVDAFALAVAGFGEAAVAFRQRADPDAGLPRARIFTNTMPEAFSDKAATFAGARTADGADDPAGELGVPSIAVTPRGSLLAGYGIGVASFAAAGDDGAAGAATRLDDGASLVAGDPVTQLAADGAAVLAWKVLRDGLGGVAVQESRADGVVTKDVLSAPAGGVVSDVRSAGSGVGDAAIAFEQGSGPNAQIVAAVVDAPPQQFAVEAPLDYTRARSVRIGWEPAEHAIGGVRYAVAVDDEQVADNLAATTATLDAGAAGDGVHTIVVTATDAAGQPTESTPAQIKIDRTKPLVRLRPRGRELTISVTDAAEGSGVLASATSIAFGDGSRIRGRRTALRHRYRRAGGFRVVVVTRDRAGNRATLRRVVRVR